MNGWVEIFRTGTHTDSRGRKMKWTERDLDRIVSTYDPKKREAPIVVGHPKSNAPAWGWVARLRRKGQVLEARFRQVAPAFLKAVRAGRYKKRSISLYPDKTLRHVGWLGGVPPAVEGMKDVGFGGRKGTITYEIGGQKMKKQEYEAEIEAQKQEYEAKLGKKKRALKKARRHAAKVARRLGEFGGGNEKEQKKAAKARKARAAKLVKKGKIPTSQSNFVITQATALGRTPEKIALTKGGKKRTIEEFFWRSLEGRDKMSIFSHLALDMGDPPSDGKDGDGVAIAKLSGMYREKEK